MRQVGVFVYTVVWCVICIFALIGETEFTRCEINLYCVFIQLSVGAGCDHKTSVFISILYELPS